MQVYYQQSLDQPYIKLLWQVSCRKVQGYIILVRSVPQIGKWISIKGWKNLGWCNLSNKNYFTDHNSDTDKQQSSVYQTQVLIPLESQAVLCTEMLKDTQKHDQKLKQWDKAPDKNTNNSANTLTKGTRRFSSYPFHSIGVPSSTTREYPFPSGQPRGKEAGNVAIFGALLSLCVWVSAH